jgi:hypothetical protein
MKVRILVPSVVVLLMVAMGAAAQRSPGVPTGRAQPRVPGAGPTPGSPPPAEIVNQDYLTYVGAFRLPGGSGPGGSDDETFNGGGEALAYNPASLTLLLTGSRCCQPSKVAEITIPEIRSASNINALATASYRQTFVDVLRGKQDDVGCNGPLGGLLPWNSDLIASVYCYYDAAYIQVRSHFRTGLNFSALPAVQGPVEVATGLDVGGRAGFVSGYMTTIPPEWQAEFGGPALTGNCCVPIITRTSWGPGLSVFNPADIGLKNPVPATTLIRYTAETPTLGRCDADGNAPGVLFNCTTSMGGVVFPRGSSSVLFFGSHGTGRHCYGNTTPDPARHLTPDPTAPGDSLCYDPARGGKGPHGYPYVHMIWAYNARDLVAVKNGQREPWQVVPYATWSFETPFSIPAHVVTGVAYDPAQQRIFLSMGEQDAPRPLIHVFDIQVSGLRAAEARGARRSHGQ